MASIRFHPLLKLDRRRAFATAICSLLVTGLTALALMFVSADVGARDANSERRQQATTVVGQFLQALQDADADGVYRYSTGDYWREFDRAKQASDDLPTFLRRSAQRPTEHLVSCSACLKQQCWTLASMKTQGPPPVRDTVLFLTRQTAEGIRVYGSYQWTKENQATFDAMEGGICR